MTQKELADLQEFIQALAGQINAGQGGQEDQILFAGQLIVKTKIGRDQGGPTTNRPIVHGGALP